MPTDEAIEKARQGVMRFRELLDIMRQSLDEGERLYEQLFDGIPPEELEGLSEKDQQGRAAHNVLEDLTILMRPALHMRFRSRDLEREFEQLHDNFVEE